MSTRILLAACALLCACEGDSSVTLGRFRVVSTRGANACGAQSMPLAPSIEYDVELKVGNGVVHWIPNGATTTEGQWSAARRTFRIVLEEDVPVWPADVRRDVVGCTVRRTDVIDGTVTFDDADAGSGADASADGGATPTARSFRGTETIVYGPAPGSDCRALVGASDGQFTTMPCNITYTLEGTRR